MSILKKKISRLINSNTIFEEFNILSEKDELAPRTFNQFPKLVLNQSVIDSLYTSRNKNVKVVLPQANNETFTLLLNEVDFYSAIYLLKADAVVNRHFTGIVEGIENSFVSLSVFKNDIACVMNVDYDPLELSKNEQNEYIYKRASHTMPEFSCGTKDTQLDLGESLEQQELKSRLNAHLEPSSNIINVFFDAVNAQQNDVEIVFNQVIANYINDPDVQVKLVFHGIKLWQYPDGEEEPLGPENLPDSLKPYENKWEKQLQSYGTYRSQNTETIENTDVYSFCILTSEFKGRQGIANLNSLCEAPYLVSIIKPGANVIPPGSTGPEGPTGGIASNYTFNSYVMSHELGHVFGSRHTFACVWERDGKQNQSLGGCSNVSEGKCAPCSSNVEGDCEQPGGNWPAGRTIMGYCGITRIPTDPPLPIFGSQPGKIIRNNVDYLICGNTCSSTITPTFLEQRAIKRNLSNLKK